MLEPICAACLLIFAVDEIINIESRLGVHRTCAGLLLEKSYVAWEPDLWGARWLVGIFPLTECGKYSVAIRKDAIVVPVNGKLYTGAVAS